MNPSEGSALTCAIMISTRNRREDLARTCAVLAQLDPPPHEVLIAVDGCTDGTEEFLRSAHPTFRLLIHQPAKGSIASRDALLRASSADLVLSLDDDSYPIERDFLGRAADLFASNAQLAVANFPQRSDEEPSSLAQENFGAARLLGSYSSSGAVLRRSVYLALGGYAPFFFHAYEEPDYALRCASAGYLVRFSPEGTIRHHYTQAQRNEMRTHHFHARNEVWSALLRCPAPQVFAVAAFRAVRQLGYAWKRGLRWVLREPLWWWSCGRGLPNCLRQRDPLPWPAYVRWMRLLRRSRGI